MTNELYWVGLRQKYFFQTLLQNCEKRLPASSYLSVCLSVRPYVRMEQLGFQLMEFQNIWSIFRKSVEKILDSLKFDKNEWYFTWRPINNFIITPSVLLGMRNVSDKICRENQIIHFMFNTFFLSCRLWDIVEKYGTAGQATDENMAHAHCMLNT
jgi:hypothetical protein